MSQASNKQNQSTIRVGDVMVSPVKTVDPKMKLWEVAEFFVGNGISGAPVMDQLGRVVTMIGEGLLMRLAAAEGLDATIAHCLPRMTPAKDVIVLKPDATFVDAYRLFLKPNVRRIPITDDNGRVVGILTRGTILKIFLEAHYGKKLAA